jgi:hypothetical protein
MILIDIIGYYFSTGLLFALPFALGGVQTMDPKAKGATLGFRILLVPGTVIFWPLLLSKLISSRKKPMQ